MLSFGHGILVLVAIVFLIGYAFGSIPFGLIFSKLAGLGDVRKIGSGNIGATNVLRTGRKDIAALTLLFDMLKGTAPVLLVGIFESMSGPTNLFSISAGCGAFIGHVFPIWLKFKGGKGVATLLGVTLGLSPLGALIFAIVWLSVAYATRYSSLAAITASLAAPLFIWTREDGFLALLMFFLALILIFKHTENIRRLLKGTESKIAVK